MEEAEETARSACHSAGGNTASMRCGLTEPDTLWRVLCAHSVERQLNGSFGLRSKSSTSTRRTLRAKKKGYSGDSLRFRLYLAAKALQQAQTDRRGDSQPTKALRVESSAERLAESALG